MQAREVLQFAVQEAEINLELEAAAEGRKPTAREYAAVILEVVNRDIEARVMRTNANAALRPRRGLLGWLFG